MAGTDTLPDFRVHEQDRSPGLGILRFLPNMADHQYDLPGLRCEDRIIGDCELIYFVGGRGEVILSGRHFECYAGTIVLIRPWELHSIISSVDEPHDNHWVHFTIEPASLAPQVLETAFPDRQRSHRIGLDPELLSAFALLESEIRGKAPGYPEAAAGILAAIFIRMWRLAGAGMGLRHADREEILLGRIEDGIRSRLEAKIDVGGICREFGVGRTVLFDLFRSRRGISPAAWIRRERLRSAELLLKTGDLSFAQIAGRTGFSDAFHFSRAFKRIYGKSPRDWLDSLRN